MKKVLSLLFVLLLGVTLVACGGNKDVDTIETLVVGLEADYPPFNWLDTSKNDTNYSLENYKGHYVDGYDVQMAMHIADQLDRRLVIKMIDWDALILALQSGEIDLIIAGMSPRPDRMEQIDFTEAYYTSNHVGLVLRNGPLANVTTVEGLRGYTGVGQTGTSYSDIVDWLGENHGVKVLNSIDSVPNIVVTIKGGDADFTIVEKPVALGLITRYPELKMILDFSTEENVFEVDDADRVVSIGMRKGTTELRNQIDTILNNITEETRNLWMADAVTRAE